MNDPYTFSRNKLESRSRPCIFLGYALNQAAFRCFDLSTNKINISCHVAENIFPYTNLDLHSTRPFEESFHEWVPHYILPITSTSELCVYLISLKLAIATSDNCLFIYAANDVTIYVVFYVDDLIATITIRFLMVSENVSSRSHFRKSNP